MEFSKTLAVLKELYMKDNIEVVTQEGKRVRGLVRSMKTVQAFTAPSVEMERADGELIRISFSDITEIIDYNRSETRP